MVAVEEACRVAADFMKRTACVDDARVIKAVRAGGGWIIELEVYQENSCIKNLGLPVKVRDRNIYSVELDEKMEVQSYGRKEMVA